MDSSADGRLNATEPRPDWVIRSIRSVDEFHACEDLQRRAWNFTGDLDIVPLTQMLGSQKAGGVVLGAFAPDGTLLGFCYSFLGRLEDGRLIHYSHMTAVDEAMRSAGLGAALKWAQRDAVLAQDVEWMAWTYDPLESLNGYFNFAKLGVIARTYWEDLYGQTTSGLHRGTPTDRLLAEWPLRSHRVERRRDGETPAGERVAALPALLRAEPGPGGHAVPGALAASFDVPSLSLEVPSRIQDIKATDPDLALAWRLATRQAFQGAFAAEYHVAECVRHESRTLYELRRGEPDLESD